MNILMITANDPAGMGIAFTKAINEFTDHTCRLITTVTKYNFDFEKDIHIPDLLQQSKKDASIFEEVDYLLRQSDIIHFHILSDETAELGPIKVKDYIDGKKIIHHHHGHPEFRSNPWKYSEKYKRLRRNAIVSTPDLLRLLPEARWQPNLVPINDPLYLPTVHNENGRLRLCQSPTRKELKNTKEFDDKVQLLKKQYFNIEKITIEDTPHTECLRIKQQCDIHFDHMQGYFGVSSLEGLSQGKPVIAGLDDLNIKVIRDFTGTDDMPWVIARNSFELFGKLEKLIKAPIYNKEQGRKARSFMEENWSEEQVLKVLIGVYEKL